MLRRRPGPELGLGRLHDACGAQHLVGLRDDAEGPLLAAHVGVMLLGLLAIGFADLMQRGTRRHPENGVRIDLDGQVERHGEFPPGLGSRIAAGLPARTPAARYSRANTRPERTQTLRAGDRVPMKGRQAPRSRGACLPFTGGARDVSAAGPEGRPAAASTAGPSRMQGQGTGQRDHRARQDRVERRCALGHLLFGRDRRGRRGRAPRPRRPDQGRRRVPGLPHAAAIAIRSSASTGASRETKSQPSAGVLKSSGANGCCSSSIEPRRRAAVDRWSAAKGLRRQHGGRGGRHQVGRRGRPRCQGWPPCAPAPCLSGAQTQLVLRVDQHHRLGRIEERRERQVDDDHGARRGRGRGGCWRWRWRRRGRRRGRGCRSRRLRARERETIVIGVKRMSWGVTIAFVSNWRRWIYGC